MSIFGKKQPLIYIGLILFVAIAAVGIAVDFIADKDGVIAIAAVCLAFVILAVFLGIEAISRRRQEQKALEEKYSDELPEPLDSSRRFLRHVDDESVTAQDDPFDDVPDNDIISEVQQQTPLRRFVSRTQNRPEQEPEVFEMPEPEPEPTVDGGVDGGEEIFTPVMRIPAPEDDSFNEEFDDIIEHPQDEYAANQQPIETQAAATNTEAQQPQNQDAPQNQSAEAPAAATAEAVTVADLSAEQDGFVPVPINFSQGQSLESFYADMSEDDILYRDCVEVWAADAKPAVLRLMKYVEGIEDKHTAALFGRECEYINAMIDRIQCFTQLEFVDESIELKKCNFAALVKDCLKRFSPFFMEKRLGLLWKGLDIDVMTDRRWFIFALTQVIFNSVEFTPEGGKIAISAKREGDFIDLIVDDSGKGISPEEMPYIFVAGYMGDDSPNEAGRRTGMGLFIAKSVINKMGGDVLAESTPGKGTRIIMRLPVIEMPED